MKMSSFLLLTFALLIPLSACGYKGKLKTPSEIEHSEAKKAKKKNEQPEVEITPAEQQQ